MTSRSSNAILRSLSVVVFFGFALGLTFASGHADDLIGNNVLTPCSSSASPRCYQSSTCHSSSACYEIADPSQYTNEFLTAVRAGDKIEVGRILGKGTSVDSRRQNPKGITESALTAAVRFGHLPVVSLLLQRRAEPLSKSGLGGKPGASSTVLHQAAVAGHIPLLEILLQARAEPDAKNNAGLSALKLAKTMNHKHSEANKLRSSLTLLSDALKLQKISRGLTRYAHPWESVDNGVQCGVECNHAV